MGDDNNDVQHSQGTVGDGKTLVKPKVGGSGEEPTPSEEDVPASESAGAENVPRDWNPGDVILGQYEVLAKLGEGGFGEVHKVHHKGWNVDMAVKSANDKVSEEEVFREAEVWMELGLHPNIASCYFVRTLGGVPRIFIEYVEGGTLREWLYGSTKLDEDGNIIVIEKPRDLTRAQRLAIAIEICRGMHHTHTFQWKDKEGNAQDGIVHRDLKPLNILMTEDGIPRVTDFGLVQFGASTARAAQADLGHVDVGRAGVMTLIKSDRDDEELKITPEYAAPEAFDTKTTPNRAIDIYAFGVMLYDIFCGRLPFVLPEHLRCAMDVLKISNYETLHREQPPPDPHTLNPDIDPELAVLMLQCLEKIPDRRHASFADIRDQVKTIYQRLENEDYDATHPEPKPAELLADSLNNRALSYLEMGQSERASTLWTESLQLNPKHLDATCNFGLQKWRAGAILPDELINQIREIGKSKELEWEAAYMLGLVCLEHGDIETATQSLKQAAQLSRDKPLVIAALTRACSISSGIDGRTFETHDGQFGIASLSLSVDGSWALSGHGDGNLRLWEVRDGRCLRTLDGHQLPVTSVCLAQGNRWALSGSEDRTIRLWEVLTGRCVLVLEGHTGGIRSVCISRDCRWGLSGGEDGKLRLWDIGTGRCVRELEGGPADSVCLSTRTGRAYSGSSIGISVIDLATGKRAQVLHNNIALSSLCLTIDGRRAMAGYRDGSIRFWDVSSGECLRTFSNRLESPVRGLCISADARYALSGSECGELRMWELTTGRCLRTHAGRGWICCLGPDACWALFAERGTLRQWDLHKQQYEERVLLAAPSFSRLQVTSESIRQQSRFHALISEADRALDCGHLNEAIKRVAIARGLQGRERDPLAMREWLKLKRITRSVSFRDGWHIRNFKTGSRCYSACLSRDGRLAKSLHADGGIRIWETDTGECVQFVAPPEGVSQHRRYVHLNTDGHWALTKTSHHSWNHREDMGLWRLDTGECIQSFNNCEMAHFSVCANGRWLLSAWRHEPLRLWETSTARCIRKFEGHTGNVSALLLDPAGRWAFSGGHEDSTVRMWDVALGRCLRVFNGHRGGISCICSNIDASRVLSGGAYGDLRIWDTSSGGCIQNLKGHKGQINCICLSSDERWAVSGGGDGTLGLWNVESGECIRVFNNQTDSVSSVCLSMDARLALSAGDTDLRLWQLDWELKAVPIVDWDEGARPHLENFLILHTPYPTRIHWDWEKPNNGRLACALTRAGTPSWTDEDFKQLLYTLGCAGYGWLRPEGVKRELEKMAANWKGPPPLFGQT